MLLGWYLTLEESGFSFLGCLVIFVFANFDTLRFISIRFSRYKRLVSVLFKSFKSHDVPDTVGLSGLEPPTSRLSGVRSNRLSYKPI